MRVALVVMPFALTDRPNLAVGLLQAALTREGIECDSKYFNLTFEKLLGSETYQTLGVSTMTPLAGEWVFSQAYYGPAVSTWEHYEDEVLSDPVWGMDPELRPAVRAAAAKAPAFLRLVLESNDWSRYSLVGFTSTFQQTFASLALAREIRRRHPAVRIALGGANFEGGMGRPYLEHFDFVDFVSTGEADISFPALCRNLRDLEAGRVRRLEVPPGLLHRRDGRVGGTPASAGGFVDLEGLPTPDFHDYFRVLRAHTPGNASANGRGNGKGRSPKVWLPVETSRGCWWGQKAHCTFCGLNGETMTFRRKSWQRVVEETDELARRHGGAPLQFSDNILAMDYFQDLLPCWAGRGREAAPPKVPKFFEIKSNLRRGQVELLRDAGVTSVQAGVENLADGTLRRMRKGVPAARNLALLRWCVEAGVRPFWNVLYGFPGESPDDYGENLRLLGKITHLPPPSGVGPIRLDRFSPNFTRWREHGFTAIRPLPAYRHLFPFEEPTLAELAYYFDYEHPRFRAAMDAGRELDRFARAWRQQHTEAALGELAVKPHWQGGFVLVDRRFNLPAAARRLSDRETALLVALDAPTGPSQAVERAAAAGLAAEPGEPAWEGLLERLLAESAVAHAGASLVTLALLPPQTRLKETAAWRLGAPAAGLRRAP